VIKISDFEHNYKNDIEERIRGDNIKGFKIKLSEPKEILKLVGLLLSSIGGILYFITVFMVSQTYTGSIFPFSSGPFLVAGILSVMGAILGVRNTKAGGLIILLSIPVSIAIGLIFFRYLDCFMCFYEFVLIPIPLPHSIFVINGGILCLVSYKMRMKLEI
jgi:hypothetical protein